MTKLLFISTLVLASLASCKKDYTCSCTDTETDTGDVFTYVYTRSISGATKAEATADCNEATIIYSEPDYTYKTECKLSK